jgi:hypothetical protein
MGQRGRFDAGGCAELAQDVGQVVAGRLLRDEQRLGDPSVGVARGDEGKDLELPRCESERVLWCRLGGFRSGSAGSASSILARRPSSSSSRRNGPASSRTARACAARRVASALWRAPRPARIASASRSDRRPRDTDHAVRPNARPPSPRGRGRRGWSGGTTPRRRTRGWHAARGARSSRRRPAAP